MNLVRPRGALAAALTTLALAAPAAHAGTPGTWTPISAPGQSSVDQPWPVRLDGGALEVGYLAKDAGAQDVLTALVTPAGRVTEGPPIVTGFATASSPALVLDRGGLRAFFGGIHSADPGDPNQGLNTATAPGGAGPWALAPGSVANPVAGDDYSYASDVSAVLAPDASDFEAWASTPGVFVHHGLDATQPDQDFQSSLGGCCGYDAQLALAFQATRPTLAWYSNAEGHNGIWVQTVDPTSGAPDDTPTLMPGSATKGQALDQRGRVAMTGCPTQPGLYVAALTGYPSPERVIVWAVGSSRSTALSIGGGEVRNVAIACGSDGRLWVAWARSTGSRVTLTAVRSNLHRTLYGAPVAVEPPAGSGDSNHLAASAQPDRLDLLGSFGEGTAGTARTWHTQVLPGLTILARSITTRSGQHPHLAVRVTDAGASVRGATVSVGGHRATTGGKGIAVLRLGEATVRRQLTVTAVARGHAPGHLRVTERVR
jgi:hypothetical protein